MLSKKHQGVGYCIRREEEVFKILDNQERYSLEHSTRIQKTHLQLHLHWNVDSDLQFLSAQAGTQISRSEACLFSLWQFHMRWNQYKRKNRMCTTVFYTSGRLPNYCAPQKPKECSSFFPRRRQEKVAKYILLHSLHLQCNTTHSALLSLALILGFLELDGQNIFLCKGYIKRELNQKLPLQ